MGELMRTIPFPNLMERVLEEYKKDKAIFGVRKFLKVEGDKKMKIFDEFIETPYGPAAGPHTQLAQNFIAAYVSGSRFFECKTVQIMDGDELSKCVARPCISAVDECYNCEWSTELFVPQALEEYIKAWFACKILAKELGLGNPDGFVFNMSVGYDLEGIKSEKVNNYLEGMKDASKTEAWKTCVDWTLANLDKFENIDAEYVKNITPKISKSVTESTLHGCPPAEIERIASYLLTEKGLHTYIKCNPTLLGYDFARETLNGLGYDYISFDDHHFKADLQWADAIPMLNRLQKTADELGLSFGVKITNTCPVDVKAGELPSEEMYMSGRSLFPLSASLALKLSREFNGKLRISYSGGADVFTISEMVNAGIYPVTMATTALKSGGYERFTQIGEIFNSQNIAEWACVDVEKYEKFVKKALNGEYFRKAIKPLPNRKNGNAVPLFDCFTAPCRGGCPIEQDIPGYMALVENGKFDEALELITHRNALPFITGTICSHRCQDKCMRNHYEDTVKIRSVKLQAAENGYAKKMEKIQAPTPISGKKVAIVGGGAAGLSAAYFLSRAGVPVTVFEKRETMGGIVKHVIPEFRISSESIDKDVELCKAYGAEFVNGITINSVKELTDKGFTHVILATGAWCEGASPLEKGESLNVIKFLESAKKDPKSLKLGKEVVIIGGGNTAMDAARAAKRVDGVEKVSIVYRRTKRYMPADEEELQMAIEDGVEFKELLAPVSFGNGILTCKKMELGAPDASGRRSPVETGECIKIHATCIISAIGEAVDSKLYSENKLEIDKRGKAVVNPETRESSIANVFVIGDGYKGPATVVEAIADATAAANAIIEIDFNKHVDENIRGSYNEALDKKGTLCTDCNSCDKAENCLACSTVCETCTQVCPNRANVAISVKGMRQRQIIHVDGMCNECGNCATFCPYDSSPYLEKFTLFCNEHDFKDSKNDGFVRLNDKETLIRLGGNEFTSEVATDTKIYPQMREVILAVYENYSYLMYNN